MIIMANEEFGLTSSNQLQINDKVIKYETFLINVLLNDDIGRILSNHTELTLTLISISDLSLYDEPKLPLKQLQTFTIRLFLVYTYT